MSSLIVKVSRLENVRSHGNAERLELGEIGGWQVVLPKGKWKTGDLVTYIPPDSVMPIELSDRIGVTKYLSNGRVKCTRLRGEPSFGVVMELEQDWAEGTDVAEHYGITKYVPKPSGRSGFGATGGERSGKSYEVPAHPLFPKYTDLENMRNYKDVFTDGEEVVLVEKIHGSNARAAYIDGVWMSGSRRRQVFVPDKSMSRSWLQRALDWLVGYKAVEPDFEACKNSWFTFPLSMESVRNLLSSHHCDIAIYGEVYGNVQGLKYGHETDIAFRAFDIMRDGKYVDYDEFEYLCGLYGVPMCPILYRGPFSLDKVKELAEGKTTMPDATHIREGVVCRPIKERHDSRIGRCLLKYVGDGYLLGDQSDTDDA